MTVCIAALCSVGPNTEPAIILCADTRGSSPLGSKESLIKDNFILYDGHWRCLGAGTDEEIMALVPLFRKHLHALAPDINETNAAPAIRAALQERKLEKANEFTQGRWGLTYQQFLQSKDSFPAEQYRSDILEIANITIEADCIVSGFECIVAGSDTAMAPVLMQTDSKCAVKIREDWAVAGEGAYLAQSVLMHRNHYEGLPFERTLYCVYEAKRYAERVSTVGVETHIAIYRRTGQSWVTEAGLEYLEEQFAKFGPQEIPDPAIKLAPDFFKDAPPSKYASS